MGTIKKYNIGALRQLLESTTLAHAWRDILATHILGQDERYHYIVDDPFFADFQVLPHTLIGGLSIGDISVLYEYSLAHYDHGDRKNKGQYFTPDDICEVMAAHTTQFAPGVWLDPCSGIGNLSWYVAHSQADPEDFVSHHLLLSDIDPLALFIARVLFTLSFQNNNPRLFCDIADRFIVHDYLSDAYHHYDPPRSPVLPHYDYVIVNPPYVSGITDDRFITAATKDLFSFFLENIALSTAGFVSITPQSFTHAKKFSSLRELLLSQDKSLDIYCFDNVPDSIFDGIKFGSTNSNTANSVRAAIMVATPAEKPQIRTTPLLRWPRAQRSQVLSQLDSFLVPAQCSASLFPKLSPALAPLYREVTSLPRLESIISTQETPWVLYVPSSPRYYITALYIPVRRTSIKTLYFATEADRDYAYVLLNSSFTYWWWRVVDGGMSLSLATLKSLPMVGHEKESSAENVAQLLASENTNKVYKMNAGKPQENVKHPASLIAEVTRSIVPQYASELAQVHSNSCLPTPPDRGDN